MTNTTKRIPHSECVQGRCASLTTGCWGECSIRAAFPLNNVACGDAVTQPRVSEQADERALPKHYGLFNVDGPDGRRIKGWNADQMREHARQAAALIAAGSKAGAAVADEENPSDASVAAIREAIADYYRALNGRQHGGLAMDRAFRSIERELGMSWDMWTKAEFAAHPGEAPAGGKGQA